jgi:hypothetical protein
MKAAYRRLQVGGGSAHIDLQQVDPAATIRINRSRSIAGVAERMRESNLPPAASAISCLSPSPMSGRLRLR